MRIVLLVLSIAASLVAGPTTITQTNVTSGDPAQLANGRITIRATVPFLAADSTHVDTTAYVVTVTGGTFTAVLEPNDTGSPITSYMVIWQLIGGVQRTEYWIVPTSSVPITLAGVMIVQSSPPVVNLTLQKFVSYTVPCIASPTFDFSQGTIQYLDLTCNVTSSSVSHLMGPTFAIFKICQEGTFSFAWPAAITGTVNPSNQSPGKCAIQSFISTDGIHLTATDTGVINQ